MNCGCDRNGQALRVCARTNEERGEDPGSWSEGHEYFRPGFAGQIVVLDVAHHSHNHEPGFRSPVERHRKRIFACDFQALPERFLVGPKSSCGGFVDENDGSCATIVRVGWESAGLQAYTQSFEVAGGDGPGLSRWEKGLIRWRHPALN